MAGAAGHVARRGIELVGQLSDALNGASLPGYGLAHFPIIAIHLYFTARSSCLGGQARDDAVGCFVMAGVDDADTPFVADLFACAVAVKDDYNTMGSVAVTTDELGEEGSTGRGEVSRFYGAKRGAILDDVVAIDEYISAHGFASLF
jgi:hypothetical protein